MNVLVIWVSLEEKLIMTFFLFLLIQTVTCPAPRHHTAKKTDSARESIATVAESNIRTPTQISDPLGLEWSGFGIKSTPVQVTLGLASS